MHGAGRHPGGPGLAPYVPPRAARPAPPDTGAQRPACGPSTSATPPTPPATAPNDLPSAAAVVAVRVPGGPLSVAWSTADSPRSPPRSA
ncbi:hypothetical protein ABZ054_33260, partial [Streptomyces sp. NPDC006324]